jgi:hypothetical protein
MQRAKMRYPPTCATSPPDTHKPLPVLIISIYGSIPKTYLFEKRIAQYTSYRCLRSARQHSKAPEHTADSVSAMQNIIELTCHPPLPQAHQSDPLDQSQVPLDIPSKFRQMRSIESCAFA